MRINRLSKNESEFVMKKTIKYTLLTCLFLITCVCSLTSCENRPDWMPNIYIEGLPELHVEVVDQGFAPTCGNAGLTDGAHCSICGIVSKSQEVIPPTENHSFVIDGAIAPTCTVDGLLEGSHCEVCGLIVKKQAVIPAPGHFFVSYDGYTFCNRCMAEPSGELSYELNSDKASYTVIGIGTCRESDIIIPSTYNNLPVTGIGDRAFYCCFDITSIAIPSSVTTINGGAFYGCSSLTKITIPDSVTKFNTNGAFYGCSSLTNITIPSCVSSIGTHMFYGCVGLTDITIPNNITSIGSYAFAYCSGLVDIVIPDKVTSIGEYAFYNCTGLTEVTIPRSVTIIDDFAFNCCSELTKITYNGTTKEWNSIVKNTYWDGVTSSYTIYCTDGEIAKDGSGKYY